MPSTLAPRLRQLWFAALVAVAATGCGTQVHYVPTNTAAAPTHPRQSHQVEVYTTGVPSRPYTEVGLYEAEEGTNGSFEQTLTDPRANAAQRGCDALVVSSVSTAVDYDPWVDMRTERRVHATCVVYEDGPARCRPVGAKPGPRDRETEEW